MFGIYHKQAKHVWNEDIAMLREDLKKLIKKYGMNMKVDSLERKWNKQCNKLCRDLTDILTRDD